MQLPSGSVFHAEQVTARALMWEYACGIPMAQHGSQCGKVEYARVTAVGEEARQITQDRETGTETEREAAGRRKAERQ